MSVATQIHPNDVARELIGRDYLSFSSISLYRQCPLKFYFKYVQGLSEKTVSANLVFGGAIHAAAEFHFRDVLAGNATPDLDTLLHVYQDEWRQRASETVRFNKGQDADSLGRLAERMLRAFQASDIAQPDGRIIGIEEELRGTLMDDVPDLLARIDLMTEADDAVVVTDLKTSRGSWSGRQLEDAGEQLLLYHALASELIPDKPVQLQFAVLTKTKTPTMDVLPVDVTPHRLERTRQMVQRIWRSIESRSFYPAPSPMNCPSCPFRDPCRAWSG